MRAVDFFCGAGGVTKGLSLAGIDVLAGIDIEQACRETYTKNNVRFNGMNVEFINGDISLMPPETLQHLLPEIHCNDDDMIFVGCSPCQYYTNINTIKDKSKDTKTLLSEFKRFVEYYRPGYILIENVPGLQHNPESPLGQFKQFLDQNGYIYEDKVLNAKYFGVPQNRRRYILVATRLIIQDFVLNLPTPNYNNIRTVRSAIGNIKIFPKIPAGYKDTSIFQHSSAGLSLKNMIRLKNTSHNGGSRIEWANDHNLQLKCYAKHEGHTDVYGRMFWDKPSPTITTRFSSISNGRYGHPEQDRAISLREGATLQSFPLDYVFYGNSIGSIARMIGNAVPPELARNVGQVIIDHYNQWLRNYEL